MYSCYMAVRRALTERTLDEVLSRSILLCGWARLLKRH